MRASWLVDREPIDPSDKLFRAHKSCAQYVAGEVPVALATGDALGQDEVVGYPVRVVAVHLVKPRAVAQGPID